MTTAVTVAVAVAEVERVRAQIDRGAGMWTILPSVDALLTALREQSTPAPRPVRIPPATSRRCADCDLPRGHQGEHWTEPDTAAWNTRYRWQTRRERSVA